MTIRNKFSLIGITALLISIAVFFFSRTTNREGKVFIYAEPVQTDSGWGYNIIANDKVYIKQEYMPAVPGRIGFKTSNDAMTVGNLVVAKITSNQIPSVTLRELDSLGLYRESAK